MSLTPQAIPGMRARLHMPEEILSLPVSGSTVLSDGDVVVQSTDGKTVSAVVGATNTKFGVVVFQHIGKSGKNAKGLEAYQAKDCAPIMQIGSVWVKPTTPVTDINAKVYVRTANATVDAPLGSLSSAALDSTELPNAAWETITGADGMAILRLRGA
ncbi:hypothetical protein ACFODO_23760 [Acinetobacter sichuanensis]|uniref:Uncharacterized protein n=1 Tax=Acinetobacter sichuanensis TaxID=2136183 RepID=A0A371YK30_9GAMM|nr:hypothetical protein [Acinetobacter sichuanensis]RFC81821.1 hypothetical protein C9E89_019695 [Acinetobacter sichuanensis]